MGKKCQFDIGENPSEDIIPSDHIAQQIFNDYQLIRNPAFSRILFWLQTIELSVIVSGVYLHL